MMILWLEAAFLFFVLFEVVFPLPKWKFEIFGDFVIEVLTALFVAVNRNKELAVRAIDYTKNNNE